MDNNELDNINLEMENMFKHSMLLDKRIEKSKTCKTKKRNILLDDKIIDKVNIDMQVYCNIIPCSYINEIERVFNDMKKVKIEMKRDRVIDCTIDYFVKLRLDKIVRIAKLLSSRENLIADVVSKDKLEKIIKYNNISEILVYFYKPSTVKRGKNKHNINGNTLVYFYNMNMYFNSNMSFSERRQYLVFY